MHLSSPAFAQHSKIPKKYASDGQNVSPPLQLARVPNNAKELVLICHDPDAPLPFGFTH
jgi:phosphatidylethanolamine-binding protein (PEBP) family uncharacterized protein